MQQTIRLFLILVLFGTVNLLNAQDCEIEIDGLETSECENGTYDIELSYLINNTENDSIDLWINNTFIGQYEISDQSIVIEDIVSNNEPIGTVLICVNNDTQCCFVYTFEQPVCEDEEPCEVSFTLEWGDCENGTYDLFINYTISNPTNDILELWVNNEYLGIFDLDPSNMGLITIEDVVPRANSDYDIVKLCINDNENCCFEEEFMPPCENEEGCDLSFILDWGPCVNGTYDLFINYTVTNPDNDLFDLWVNGEYEGNFEIDPSGSGVITIEDVTPSENSIYDIVDLCVNDNENCCQSLDFMPDDCEDGCSIELEVETSECINGVYTLSVFYTVIGSETEYLSLYLHGDLLGEYNIEPNGSGEIIIQGVTPNGSDLANLALCTNEGTCCEDLEFEEPNCESEPCEVTFTLEWGDCENGTYDLFINYNIDNPGNEFLDLWVNNEFVGNFEIDPNGLGLITIEDVVPRANAMYDIVELCINDNENCCFAEEFMPPCENEEACSISINVETSDCIDGVYQMDVNYEITGNDSEVFDLFINGNFIDEFEIDPSGTGTVTVEEITPITDGLSDVVTICTNDLQCCLEYEYEAPCEAAVCSIDGTVNYPDCIEGGTFELDIEYEVENVNEFVELWINGVSYGEFEVDPSGSGSITVQQAIPNPNSNIQDVSLCGINGQVNCCYHTSFELEACNGTQEDQAPYQLYNESNSSEIILDVDQGMALNYQVYSSSGQLVNYKENVRGTEQIKTGLVGIYMIRIEANRKVFYHKILSIQ